MPILEFREAEVNPSAGERLDVFLAKTMGRSRSRIQAWLKEGRVTLRPATARSEASYRLRAGDELTVRLDAEPAKDAEAGPKGEAIPLDVIYEDKAMLAINKQPGLVVHPAAGHREGTLVNALVHRFGAALAGRGGIERLGIVHRLDKDTSGLMLVAKSDEAHEKLAAAFAGREVVKVYRALCWGLFRRKTGECRGEIGRHRVHRQKMVVLKTGGRSAHTDYRVLAQGRFGAEVECGLHTGRTHQIRVHLAHLGQPVWGDLHYGKPHPLPDGFAPARQMLHSARLEIAHPLTGELLKLEASLPDDFREAQKRLLEA